MRSTGGDTARWSRTAVLNLVVAGIYAAAAIPSLELASLHPGPTAMWPPAGLGFAAALVSGYVVWPGILLGAFLTYLIATGAPLAALGMAAGSAVEAVAGAHLVNRFARGRQAFDRESDIVRFALLAGMGSSMIAATAGVASLALGQIADRAQLPLMWTTWWLGSMTGTLVFAPPLVLWANRRLTRWSPQTWRAGLLILAMALITFGIFGGLVPDETAVYLLFGCIPLLLWAAFRFTRRQAATTTAVLSLIATWGTHIGEGPFARAFPEESILLLDAFTVFMSLMTLAVSSLVAERHRIEEELERLAVTDSLTGLANYRRFVQVLEDEVRRCLRTGRQFALVLLDLDGLKRINDTHGHLVGKCSRSR